MAAKKSTAFPAQQLFVLTLVRLCEPIAFTSIFPYFYYMILSFDPTRTPSQIATFTGLGVSAFAFTEFLTGMWWGRTSDRIGRKPVLLGGLAGTGLSSLMFGFSTSLPMAICARALGGLLNGNIGVIQTTVAEIVTVREHQPRAYSLMPFIWSVGAIIGPAMGGLLAEPVKHYPSVFPQGGLFEKFPFLLPNIVCAVITTVGVIFGWLFLDETHEIVKQKRDIGRECGRWLQHNLPKLYSYTLASSRTVPINAHEEAPLLQPSTSPSNLSTFTGSHSSSSSSIKSPPFTKTWTPLVLHNILAYGLIAYHSMSFDQLIPVYLQTPYPSPSSRSHTHLPFQFPGGFSMSTQSVGVILAVQGIFAMSFQFLFFPILASRLGVLRLFRLASLAWPVVYIFMPYTSFLGKESVWLMPALYLLLFAKIVFGASAYPCNAILLTNAAPSLLVLGTINGAAASLASIARAVGPMVSGLLFSLGLKVGSVGLAFWAVAVVAIMGAVQSCFITEGLHKGIEEGEGVVVGEEAVRTDEPGVVVKVREEESGLQVVDGEAV